MFPSQVSKIAANSFRSQLFSAKFLLDISTRVQSFRFGYTFRDGYNRLAQPNFFSIKDEKWPSLIIKMFNKTINKLSIYNDNYPGFLRETGAIKLMHVRVCSVIRVQENTVENVPQFRHIVTYLLAIKEWMTLPY